MNKKQIIILTSVIVILILVIGLYWLRISQRELQENIETLMSVQDGGTLSENGELAKQNIVEALGGETGTLLVTESMEIGYLNPPDERIIVFISNVDIEKTESDAINWLLGKGFSREDLCNFPVVFSVDNPQAQPKEEYKLLTNYLPPYCLE